MPGLAIGIISASRVSMKHRPPSTWSPLIDCTSDPEGTCGASCRQASLFRARPTHIVLAAAHRDHDTANNVGANLAAFCQRSHMIHDRPEHQRRRWRTLFRRKALGDLFGGPYA